MPNCYSLVRVYKILYKSTRDEQAVMNAGGVIALMHACGGSSAELQIATLTVLRQLVVQPTGPDAFLVARAVPLLAMLQHSLVAEIRILATKILDRISASSSVAEEAIADEQLVQVRNAVTCPKFCICSADSPACMCVRCLARALMSCEMHAKYCVNIVHHILLSFHHNNLVKCCAGRCE